MPRANLAETPHGHLDEGALREVLGYRLAQAAVVTSAVYAASAGLPDELRPVEFTVLVLVARNPGVTPGRLARALAVTAANITPFLDRLERRGLIGRRRDEQDRRAQRVEPTAAGRALADQALARVLANEQATLAAALTPGERAILIELLHKVAAARPAVG